MNAHFQSRTSGAVADSIHKLGDNRFGCHVFGLNTSEFSIVVFDIDRKNRTVTMVGTISLKAQHKGTKGSAASGSFYVLPNDKLLTFQSKNDPVQVWDTKTLNCIIEWKWADVVPTDERFFPLM